MIKTISGSRLKRLIEIDAFLSRRGSEDNPATIADICSSLGITDKNKMRGIRKIIDSLCDDFQDEKSSFRIVKVEDKKSVRYMIPPGHSLFRRNLVDIYDRDLTVAEKKLICDIFSNLGGFRIAGLKHIEDLTKESTAGLSKGLADRKCIDLGVKAPERNRSILFSGLFEAIAARKVIRLFYRPMRNLSEADSIPSSILFCPWQLRRFGDRWGLIGAAKSDGFILKLYIEQVVSFEDTGETFRDTEMQRLDGIFDDVIGMDAPRHLCVRHPDPETVEKPEDIYVWIDPERVQYLRSFPLHYSMDELDEDWDETRQLRLRYPSLPEGGAIFRMNVYVTHTLKQALMTDINRMIVLEPEYLRLDLEDRIGKMKALYAGLSAGKTSGEQPPVG